MTTTDRSVAARQAARRALGHALRPFRQTSRRFVGVHEPLALEARQLDTERRLAALEGRFSALTELMKEIQARPGDLATHGYHLDDVVEVVLAQRSELRNLAQRLTDLEAPEGPAGPSRTPSRPVPAPLPAESPDP